MGWKPVTRSAKEAGLFIAKFHVPNKMVMEEVRSDFILDEMSKLLDYV